MTGKLTPRVGDRVLVRMQGDTRTYIGTVVDMGTEQTASVDIDGMERRALWLHELTVVDREPVEWPEGWRKYNDHGVVFHQPSNVALPRDDLAQLLATGPDMLARWDELIDGDA